MKLKSCKICKKKYRAERQLQQTCSVECSIEYGKQHLANKSKEKKKTARKELMEFNRNDKTVLKRKAQILINKYARLRDERERGYKCCTCNHSSGQMDGGHFLPTSGYSAIRYNTNQIHQQCKRCNRFNGGMPKEYRLFMINKYGLEYVEKLESKKNETRSYDIDYYVKLIRVVKKKIKKLEKSLKS